VQRREFIKQASATVAVIAASSTLVSCGTAAPVVQQVVTQGAKTVVFWFAQYIAKIGAEKAFDKILDFAQSRDSAEKEEIDKVNKMMEANGFEKFDGHKVYLRNGIYTYDVGHNDNFNGCAVLYDSMIKPTSLIEGPTVIGLAKAAEEYREAISAQETASALLPITEYQKPNQNAFSKSYDQEYVAITDFGSVIVDYKFFGSNTGSVSVQIQDRDAVQRFRGDYDVEFSS